MRVRDVFEYFGSINALAKFLNISRDSVYKWGEFVPVHRQYELEVKTKGRLKSDYSLEQEKKEKGNNDNKSRA